MIAVFNSFVPAQLIFKKATEYLHGIGNKNKENFTHSDPAWHVPDIRIFGVKESEIEIANFKSALLHVKKGEKDGYASTLTHKTHRMISGFKHILVLIHEKMDAFIKKNEEERGEYEFVSQ